MGATAAIVVGTGIEVYSQIQAGEQKAQAAEKNAFLERQQAQETLDRASLNIESIRRQGESLKANQIGAFAKAGVDASVGSPLLALETTAAGITREIYNTHREAEFRSNQLLQGADYTASQANDFRNASYIGAGSSILTSAGRLASTSSKNSYTSQNQGSTSVFQGSNYSGSDSFWSKSYT